MEDMSFANYILSEKRLSEKMNIICYFKRKHDCFFDNTVIFKTEICRMFLEYVKLERPGIDLDANLILTACLLYGCKKTALSFDLQKVKTYAEEGSKYLATLGFDERFCKICKEVNRYTEQGIREKESDVLELIDNFGMLLDRDDRRAFSPVEALFIMENENLAGKENRYLRAFKDFVMEAENSVTLGLDTTKLITKWQKKINALYKYNYTKGIRAQMEYRTESKKIYIESKKIQKNKKGYKTNKNKINSERRMKQELARQMDIEHKFSDLLENKDIS